MLVTTTAGTWGITGAQFLWGYGALCAATAAGVWHTYRRALGPLTTTTEAKPRPPMADDPRPSFERNVGGGVWVG